MTEVRKAGTVILREIALRRLDAHKERHIVGSIDGQRDLTFKTGNQTSSFAFTLYLIPAVK